MQKIFLDPSNYNEVKEVKDSLYNANENAAVLKREGKNSIIIVSAHGFSHIREGQVKTADNGSFDLSLLLSIVSDSHWIAVAKDNQIDSNFHRNTEFKKELSQFVGNVSPSLVIDIHTAHAWRPFDVDIGTLYSKSLMGHEHLTPQLIDLLDKFGFLATDNAVFTASGATEDAQTITKFVSQELGCPCMQLEISSALTHELNTRQAMHQNAKLVNALAYFIKAFN